MKVEYDRISCDGWFQCVQEWDAFDVSVEDDVADLADSEAVDDQIFVREVPEEAEANAKAAAESCPVNAIKLYEDDEQIYP